MDGDKLAIPDDTQFNGSVSYQEGYGENYQIVDDQDPNFKDIERLEYNQSLSDITENIQQYQQHGVPNFITTTDNGGTPFSYDEFAVVLFTDGNVYISLESLNEDIPPSSKWRVAPNGENVVFTDDLIGEVKSFAYVPSTAPNGFLSCDGLAISRTTFAALFSKVGTVWGIGDGSTTFNLPDFRGEFLRGFDDGRGVDAGRTFGETQIDDFKAHTHDILHYISSDQAGENIGGANLPLNETSVTESTGGSETRPINETVTHFIRFQ